MPSKRGLPDSFDLEVADDEEPAELGNFLERSLVPPTPARARPPLEAVPDEPQPVVEAAPVATAAVQPATAEAASESSPVASPEPKRRRKSAVRRGKRPPRKEVGLDAQTIDMIEALVKDARDQSAEPDIRASEVVRALVQAAYEARRHVSYSGVGKRGQWGSQTARALVVDLKDAIAQAVRAAEVGRKD